MSTTAGATASPDPTCRDVAPDEWVAAAASLRDEGFRFFDWLTAVDQSDDEQTPGFDIVLHLYDTSEPAPMREQLLRTRLPAGQALPSLTRLFAGAAWHERETHEMFGIDVDGFDDGTGLGLRPLLLPNGFEGNPLLKSFMLAARASKPWPGAKEPGEGPGGADPEGRGRPAARRRVQAPGVPPAEWGPR